MLTTQSEDAEKESISLLAWDSFEMRIRSMASLLLLSMFPLSAGAQTDDLTHFAAPRIENVTVPEGTRIPLAWNPAQNFACNNQIMVAATVVVANHKILLPTEAASIRGDDPNLPPYLRPTTAQLHACMKTLNHPDAPFCEPATNNIMPHTCPKAEPVVSEVGGDVICTGEPLRIKLLPYKLHVAVEHGEKRDAFDAVVVKSQVACGETLKDY